MRFIASNKICFDLKLWIKLRYYIWYTTDIGHTNISNWPIQIVCVCGIRWLKVTGNFDKFKEQEEKNYFLFLDPKIAWTFEIEFTLSQWSVVEKLFFPAISYQQADEKKNVWIDRSKSKCQQVSQVDDSFIHEFEHFRFQIVQIFISNAVESYE